MKSLLSVVFGICVAVMALVSCRGASKKLDAAADSTIVSSLPVTQFPYPDIPAMFVQPDERMEFLLNHYWDNFPFTDTVALNNQDVTDHGYVNYIA